MLTDCKLNLFMSGTPLLSLFLFVDLQIKMYTSLHQKAFTISNNLIISDFSQLFNPL